jgi:hypothetical protein
MPVPNLIHPVPIIVEQLGTSDTLMDNDIREPIQQSVRAASKTVQGQVNWDESDGLRMAAGGNMPSSSGYVLFRFVDLDAKSIILKVNDRLLKIGHAVTNVYITRFKLVGHYPDTGGATMVKAFFDDRTPSRQA